MRRSGRQEGVLGLTTGRPFGDKARKYSTLWIRRGAIAGGLIWRLGRPECSGRQTMRLVFKCGRASLGLRQLQVLARVGRQSWPAPAFDGERRNGASQ